MSIHTEAMPCSDIRVRVLNDPPARGIAGSIAFSSDPGVVASRSVGLQRYMDLLACSGCPAAAAALRVFLQLDSAPEKRTKKAARGGCGCGAGLLDCSDFLLGRL